jgi:hypothetical protein
MVYICIENGCETRCVFGTYNGPPVFCSKHKKNGMVDVKNKRCSIDFCLKYRVYGIEFGKPTHCSEHKLESMKNSINNICLKVGCTNFSNYGIIENKKIFCFKHKKNDMINFSKKTCIIENCTVSPSFNTVGEKPIYCVEHKTDVMIQVVNIQCTQKECGSKASFGYSWGNPVYCSLHKSENMKDVVNKKCTSCGLFIVSKKNNYLCYYCVPFPRLLKKEHKIKALLEEKGLKFEHNKQINNDCCLKYRPDFLLDCGTYFVVLEVDEDAHSSYDKDCEIVRMNNISTGLGLPTLFIRYNPDLPGVKCKKKHRILIETLTKCLSFELLEDPTPIYLFYPGFKA